MRSMKKRCNRKGRELSIRARSQKDAKEMENRWSATKATIKNKLS